MDSPKAKLPLLDKISKECSSQHRTKNGRTENTILHPVTKHGHDHIQCLKRPMGLRLWSSLQALPSLYQGMHGKKVGIRIKRINRERRTGVRKRERALT